MSAITTTSMTTLTSSSISFTETSLGVTSGEHGEHHFSASSLLTNSFDGSFSALTQTPLSTCSNDIDDHHHEDEEEGDEEYDDNDDDDDDDEDDADLADAIWRINSKQAAYYRSQFSALQPDLQGLVWGKMAKVFFERSGLPVSELSAVWKLSDADRDGALSLPEFSIAMHLVVLRRKGVPLPATLPSVMQQVYGSLGVPVYHLPSPLVPPPTYHQGTSENLKQSSLFTGHYQAPFNKNEGDQSYQNHANQSEGSTPCGDDSIKNTGSNICERKKQWTVFTESPVSGLSADNDHHHYHHPQEQASTTSIDGQVNDNQPVNFDYNAESIASNPHIRHPVPLRFSPLFMAPSTSTSTSSLTTVDQTASSTVNTFSAFSRLSMASSGTAGGDSGVPLFPRTSGLHSTSELLSSLPLSAISATIPGEWHVVSPKNPTTFGAQLGSSNGGLRAGQLNDFMVSPDFGDNNVDDDEEKEVDEVGDVQIVHQANSSSSPLDYSPPYLIPREGTLHSVLAIQGLEERLIARYMTAPLEPSQAFLPEKADKSSLEKAVKTLQEANALASQQNEALLVEMLTLLKLVRKEVNKTN